MFGHSFKVGLSFGLVSGIITTLGLIVGLEAGTHSKLVVLGGIITIAVADALSDALGIHISEESENKHTPKEIWISTVATLLSKAFFALTFVVPVLLLELSTAVIASAVWGLSLIGAISFVIARQGKENIARAVAGHIAIALVVIAASYCVGSWVSAAFG